LRKIGNRRGPAYQHDPRASLPRHHTHHAWPHRHTTSHRPPRVPCCMGATAATCLRVLPRCLPCHALLHCRYYLPAYHCSPPLPPLLSTAALLLRHSEKLPPSSLRCPPPRSRNLPQIAHRREEPPEASRGRTPSASAVPRCGQHASDSEPVCRHLPKLGTGTVLLSDPPAKLLHGLRHSAPPAYSRPSAPSWRLNPGESPTAHHLKSSVHPAGILPDPPSPPVSLLAVGIGRCRHHRAPWASSPASAVGCQSMVAGPFWFGPD
jgi:hypothetical protein